MKKQSIPKAINNKNSKIGSLVQQKHSQEINNTFHEESEKKNDKKSSPVKDLRLLLNNKQYTQKDKEIKPLTNDVYNNKSGQKVALKQKSQQKSQQKSLKKVHIKGNTNDKLTEIKLIKEQKISITQKVSNKQTVKQSIKTKDQSSKKTDIKKQHTIKKQQSKQLRKQTSSTKLSQSHQTQNLIVGQKSHLDSKAIINNVNQTQKSNLVQKKSRKIKQKQNSVQKRIIKLDKQTKNQTKKVSINNQPIQKPLQILQKKETSPKIFDKNYIVHDCLMKNISSTKSISLNKQKSQPAQTKRLKKSIQMQKQSPKKQTQTVKQLVNKIAESQLVRLNKKKPTNSVEQNIINLKDQTKADNKNKSLQKQIGQKTTLTKNNQQIVLLPKQIVKSNSIQQKNNAKNNKNGQYSIVNQQPQIKIENDQNDKKKSDNSYEDVKRIQFLKKLNSEKALIQKRQLQKKQQQEIQRLKSQQKKKQQQQRQIQIEKQNKRRSISQRLEEIQRRKQQRKNQLAKQNKQYVQKKSEFTLQHKLVNQWLEKELQQNQIKERQLQAKISKMKPSNHLQQIQEHKQLIESYKKLHQSRLTDSDLKYQQQKSRSSIAKLYKSNWYKQISQNDPSETFQIEEEKRKDNKQLLLINLDNRKKYSQYVKVNYKPDSDQQSAFRYEQRMIADISAEKIRRMGLQNLQYSKQHVQSQSQKKFHPSTERNQSHEYKNYLQQIKTQRTKRQKGTFQEDFNQIIDKTKKVKNSTKQIEQVFKKINKKQSLSKSIEDSKNIKRGTSLPSLSAQSTSQPKLKINLTKLQAKAKNLQTDDLLKEIQSKFKILQKVVKL